MAARWKVDQNNGDWAELSHNLECIEVERPDTMSVDEFRDLFPPGTMIVDRVITKFKKSLGNDEV